MSRRGKSYITSKKKLFFPPVFCKQKSRMRGGEGEWSISPTFNELICANIIAPKTLKPKM
jgi:hypothetical protein